MYYMIILLAHISNTFSNRLKQEQQKTGVERSENTCLDHSTGEQVGRKQVIVSWWVWREHSGKAQSFRLRNSKTAVGKHSLFLNDCILLVLHLIQHPNFFGNQGCKNHFLCENESLIHLAQWNWYFMHWSKNLSNCWEHIVTGRET